MKVTLIDYTGAGSHDEWYAANILLYTKSTRLNMHPGLLAEIAGWPEAKKIEELRYMSNTLPSSWEFVDYTLCIEGVTRAFTHQLVRTRNASYAQQAMRILNVSESEPFPYATGPTIEDNPKLSRSYKTAMSYIDSSYRDLINEGADVQDARGLLPTNILTNINMKTDMRNFCDMARKRASLRVQDEYREFIVKAKNEVLKVHPWMRIFLNRTVDKAASDLRAEIDAEPDKEKRMRMLKLMDQVMTL